MAKQNIKITGVDASSIGTYVGTFYSLIGLAVGIILAFSATFNSWLGTEGFNFFRGLGFGLAVGFFSVILYPIVYFIIGWVQGWIFGIIFNLVSSTMGGIKIETE